MNTYIAIFLSLVWLVPQLSFAGGQPEASLDVNIYLRCGISTEGNNQALIETSISLQRIGADDEVCVSMDKVISRSEVMSITISESMAASEKYDDPLWSKIIDDLQKYDIEIVNNNRFEIEIVLDEKGKKKLENISINSIGEQLVITVDQVAFSIPVIVEPILNGKLYVNN